MNDIYIYVFLCKYFVYSYSWKCDVFYVMELYNDEIVCMSAIQKYPNKSFNLHNKPIKFWLSLYSL